MTRVQVTKLVDGAEAVRKTEFADRTFSLQTQPGNKTIVLAAESQAEKQRWYNTIKKCMDEITAENEEMHKTYTLTMEFSQRPLGFRVEEQFIVSENGERKEVLMVTKIQPDA